VNKKFAVPRGTSDILPDNIPLWEALETKARKICKSYGYREIRTPVYEDINLFKRSLGATSDVVNKQLLELAPSTESTYALRPEGTASVVRSYLENSFDKNEALSKFFYIGPMFRGERPQKGRLRQFHQIGIEAIGPNSSSPFLDAEVIALAMHLLKELGVKNSKLKINSLGSTEDRENSSIWLRTGLRGHEKDLCEDCQNRLERNVLRIWDCKNERCKKVIRGALKIENAQQPVTLVLTPESTKYFSNVRKCLDELSISYDISLDLVRGLDYYTHTVFEITAEGDLGSQDAVGAGGRYNGLVHELGGHENVEGVGFALGIERILLASGQSTVVPSGIDVFVIAMKEEYQPQAFLLLQQLREAGISADMNFVSGSMKSQMGKANKANARFALIIGDQEFKDETISVKDMSTSKQEIFRLSEVIEVLKKGLE
jgi:histidyl-tRNA synthetase